MPHSTTLKSTRPEVGYYQWLVWVYLLNTVLHKSTLQVLHYQLDHVVARVEGLEVYTYIIAFGIQHERRLRLKFQKVER